MSFQTDQRRKEIIKLLLADPDLSVKDAMIKVGYSEAYAGNSTQLTESKSFIELLNESIPNQSLVSTIRAIMNRRAVSYLEYEPETEDEFILDDISKRGGEFPKIKMITKTRRVEAGTEEDPDDEFLEDDQPKKKRKKYVNEEYQMKEVRYYLADETAVDRMLDKVLKIRGDYAPEKKKIIGLIGFTQLLDELQDGDATHKPTQSNGEPTH